MPCPYNNSDCLYYTIGKESFSGISSDNNHKMGESCFVYNQYNQKVPMQPEQENYVSSPLAWWQLNHYPGSLGNSILQDNNFLLGERIRNYTQLISNGVWLPKKFFSIKDNYNGVSSVVPRNSEISSIPYATLSYSWGSKEEKIILNNVLVNGTLEQVPITRNGFKASNKAIATCKHLGIDYLWIDQLCIDQNSDSEKQEEMSKMGKYYGNSAVTLIAVHINIGEAISDPKKIIGKIVNSEWFTRAWTFQEGLLSQRTLFMFDDCLVDGGFLARNWIEGMNYSPDNYNSTTHLARITNFSNSLSRSLLDVNRAPGHNIATPLGWVNNFNYKPSVSDNDGGNKLIMRLGDALKAIEHRESSKFIDSINSILGVLLNGERVRIQSKVYYTESDIKQILENICSTTVDATADAGIFQMQNHSLVSAVQKLMQKQVQCQQRNQQQGYSQSSYQARQLQQTFNPSGYW